MSGSHHHPSDASWPNGYRPSQPHFVQPLRHVAPRERYRSINLPHDAVEDDGFYRFDMPLDEFDQRLLEQPYGDRQRAAERGRARLSLAPGPSRFFAATGAEFSRYGVDGRAASDGRGVANPQPYIGTRLSTFDLFSIWQPLNFI